MSYQLKTQTIYCGDNLKMLKEVPDESVDLIYIDPPFNSNRNYECFWGDAQERRAFEDRFGDAKAYIDYMRPRVFELYRVLKKTGSFYYHCDWHASHYVKVMLDEMFGFNNFQNEIVWKRTSSIKKSQFKSKKFSINNDNIFFYSKSNKFLFNEIKILFSSEDIVKRYPYIDEKGRYTKSPVLRSMSMGARPNLCYEYKGYSPPNKAGWKVSLGKLIKIDNDGDLGWTKNNIPFRKYRPEHTKGTLITNIWDDIEQTGGHERLGYPTQKPIALLERIIQASSNKGDVVLDAFCGCGTTLVASQILGRKWIGIDISPTACRVMADRLYDLFNLREGKDFYVEDLPKTEDDLRILPPFEFQNWAVIALGGIPSARKSGDYGIDGKLYHADIKKSKAESDKIYHGDMIGETETYYPIQVKQRDKVGRPDIDSFETAIRRDYRHKGFFVAFDYSRDAIEEIKRLDKEGEISIIPVTVKELLRHNL